MPCYNVQTIVDSKNKLTVDFDVTTCPDDKCALVQMTENAKEIMGMSELEVNADKGYYNGEDIEKCEANGTVCYIPRISDYSHAPDRNYDKSKFEYDPKNDCYICIEVQTLPFRQFNKRKDSKEPDRVYYNTKACRNCLNKEKCTTNKRDGRKIYRNPQQDILDIVNGRLKTNEAKKKFSERKKIVEHPFVTIKVIWGYKQFLCMGQKMTTAETSLDFLAYNFRRVCNIFKQNNRNLTKEMAK